MTLAGNQSIGSKSGSSENLSSSLASLLQKRDSNSINTATREGSAGDLGARGRLTPVPGHVRILAIFALLQ
jgi:hypothetical protein